MPDGWPLYYHASGRLANMVFQLLQFAVDQKQGWKHAWYVLRTSASSELRELASQVSSLKGGETGLLITREDHVTQNKIVEAANDKEKVSSHEAKSCYDKVALKLYKLNFSEINEELFESCTDSSQLFTIE